jgi:hypothetical protein
VKVTSQMRSLTSLTPTFCRAKTVLTLIFCRPKQIRPQRVTVLFDALKSMAADLGIDPRFAY